MTIQEAIRLPAGRDLDVAAELYVFGNKLIPPRDKAFAEVGLKYVCSTGNPFVLTTGERVYVPDGDLLPPVVGYEPGGHPYNARYFIYIAKHLGDKVLPEVDAIREPARKFSTDPAASKLLREKMRENGWNYAISGSKHGFRCTFKREYIGIGEFAAQTEEHCCAVAALKAVATEGKP